MEEEVDWYAVLGLDDGGPHVVNAVIRKAYRKRALELHPDKRGDDPVAGQLRASCSRRFLSLLIAGLIFCHVFLGSSKVEVSLVSLETACRCGASCDVLRAWKI